MPTFKTKPRKPGPIKSRYLVIFTPSNWKTKSYYRYGTKAEVTVWAEGRFGTFSLYKLTYTRVKKWTAK